MAEVQHKLIAGFGTGPKGQKGHDVFFIPPDFIFFLLPADFWSVGPLFTGITV